MVVVCGNRGLHSCEGGPVDCKNTAIAGAKHPQNAAVEGYVLNNGILPLYRVDAVPSNFDLAKPDVPRFRAPLYRVIYCTTS